MWFESSSTYKTSLSYIIKAYQTIYALKAKNHTAADDTNKKSTPDNI